MIVKGVIEKTLKSLNRRYSSESIVDDQVYFAKLAILELSGWVEISIDDLARMPKKILKNSANTKYLDSVIKRNSSFSYEDHFRHLMSISVGVHTFDAIEQNLDPLILAQFSSQLGLLKEARNVVAHTFVRGQTSIIDAPSVTVSRLEPIYNGLKAFEAQIKVALKKGGAP